MRLGITLENQNGLNGNVSSHFGQCEYFLIVDIENEELINSKVVPNTATHGGGGCVAVDEILKHEITHVISGGMGEGAQVKFAQAGVEVFGFSGSVAGAIKNFLGKTLDGLGACHGHGDCS